VVGVNVANMANYDITTSSQNSKSRNEALQKIALLKEKALHLVKHITVVKDECNNYTIYTKYTKK